MPEFLLKSEGRDVRDVIGRDYLGMRFTPLHAIGNYKCYLVHQSKQPINFFVLKVHV